MTQENTSQQEQEKKQPLEGFRKLLASDLFILNAIAALIYEEKSQAVFQRLRSRTKGRHRFREEEFKKLVNLLQRISKNLSKTATKIQKVWEEELKDNPEKNKKLFNFISYLEHPAVNLKYILTSAGKKIDKSYYDMYDALRRKTKIEDVHIQVLLKELSDIVSLIDDTVEQAKKEAKQYTFSYGRGQHSHLYN